VRKDTLTTEESAGLSLLVLLKLLLTASFVPSRLLRSECKLPSLALSPLPSLPLSIKSSALKELKDSTRVSPPYG